MPDQNGQYERKPALGSSEIAYESSDGLLGDDVMRDNSIDVRKHLSNEWWLWEIIGMMTSFLSWVALIVILAVTNGEPQEQWFKVISVNTVISLLVSLARATMMVGVSSSIGQSKWLYFKTAPRIVSDMQLFDSASRGMLGSIEFIFRIRWQVATLGALLMILSVAIDPFAQQVVRIESRLVGEPLGTAKFSFTHSYSSTAIWNNNGMDAQPLSIDTAMRGAILKGLYNLNLSEPYTCPGSCSWNQPYISLGFRSACQNVTLATIATQKCEHSGSLKDCNMTTPSGLNLFTHFVATDTSTVVTITARNASARLLSSLANLPETIDPNEFIRIAVFRAPPSYNSEKSIIGEEILECTLSLTAYNYSNIQAKGSSITKQVVESPLTKNGSLKFDNKTDGYNSPALFSFDEPGLPLLNIRRADWNAIVQFFSSTQFVGTLVAGDGADSNTGVAALPFYNANVTKVFEDIATSMTNQMRITEPGMEIGLGLTDVPVGFLVVQWAYLALPLATAVCSALLLVFMIINNRRTQGVPLWKSSALALLYHDVRSSDGTIVSNFRNPSVLEGIAMSTKVKLT